MARLIQKLTEAKIRTLTDIKLHPDGAGLYLQIRPGGARSWIYRFTLDGRTRDMGLGALADVSLIKAREKAGAARALIDDGIDPIEHTRAQAIIPTAPKRRLSPTFEETAESYMADRLKRLRSQVHRHQWRQTLVDYAYPVIGKMPVDEIETNDVLAVLKPMHTTKERVVLKGPDNGKLSVPQAARRDAPVRCEACGRTVIRRSRQQRFCSDRCRDFARRENNARTAFKNPVAGTGTGKPTNPPKKSNGANGLHAAKPESTPRIYGPRRVIERELFGGRDWHEEVSPDGVVSQVAQLRRAP
jgi:hypothetical protein